LNSYNLIAVIGPTASGKTRFAARLAYELDGEIISGDSRQVYRGMDIGTGKDLADYVVNGVTIPYHLIDVASAGAKYNVYEFQRDFTQAFAEISSRGKWPLLCGGTGLYVEAVLKGYKLLSVPVNEPLRQQLAEKSLDELSSILATYKPLHNKTDVETHRRAVRAIEIADYQANHPDEPSEQPLVRPLIVGVDIHRDLRRQRISQRLRNRVDEGMTAEVEALLKQGVSPDDLIYYGLEYKYVTLYVTGQMSFDEMYGNLEIAIHQFAKRQMTWFRGMERRGFTIHWIDYLLSEDERVEKVKTLLYGRD
jgi:tRNA dimethylallyltransferase